MINNEHTGSFSLLNEIMNQCSGCWKKLQNSENQSTIQKTFVKNYFLSSFSEIPEIVARFHHQYGLEDLAIDLVTKLEYQNKITFMGFSRALPNQSLILEGLGGYSLRLGYFVTTTTEASIFVSYSLDDPASYEKTIVLKGGQMRYRKFVINGIEKREMGSTEIKVL